MASVEEDLHSVTLYSESRFFELRDCSSGWPALTRLRDDRPWPGDIIWYTNVMRGCCIIVSIPPEDSSSKRRSPSWNLCNALSSHHFSSSFDWTRLTFNVNKSLNALLAETDEELLSKGAWRRYHDRDFIISVVRSACRVLRNGAWLAYQEPDRPCDYGGERIFSDQRNWEGTLSVRSMVYRRAFPNQ